MARNGKGKGRGIPSPPFNDTVPLKWGHGEFAVDDEDGKPIRPRPVLLALCLRDVGSGIRGCWSQP